MLSPSAEHRCSRYELISELERAETESIATKSASVCSTVIIWSAPASFRSPTMREGRTVALAYAAASDTSTPQSLLQIVESLDHFFLNQVLPFGNDWLTGDYNFAHGRSR